MATKAKTVAAKPAAAQPAATATEQKYLTPVAVDTLLGDSRQMFVDIVKGLPAKLRNDFMREGQYYKAMILRGPQSELLKQAHPKSLIAAFVNSASLGLTLNPIKKQCTIIARWNNVDKIYEADNLIMYPGLMFLATQAGVKDISVDVVYTADKFTIKKNSDGDFFEHEINTDAERGTAGNEFKGVFVAARMPNSNVRRVEWVPAADIYKMREQSDSYLDKDGKPRASSPWVKWFDEQAKKGGLKRASKRWDDQVEENEAWNAFKSAVDRDNQQEHRIEPRDTDIVQEEEVSLEQAVQIDEAMKAAEMKTSLILDAYEVEALKNLPASKFEEILQRVKTFGENKKAKKAKTAPAAEAAKPATEVKK